MSKIKIPFGKIYFDDKEKKALISVLETGWWSTGARTKNFEEKFANYVGAKYTVFVNSATTALFLALEALQVKKKTFKVPSLTFTASAAEIIHSDNKIKFIDVNRETMCAEGKYKGALMKVHYGGNYSNASGSITIEDSAHLIKKNQCKNNPNIVCFSFAYSKNMTCGEGGMMAINNKKIYQWLRKARFFGINREIKKQSWPYQVDFLGWKGNATEFQAALGIVQLAKLEKINECRQKIVEKYNKNFGYNWQGLHLYPIFVKNRAKFLKLMFKAGIQCSIHYIPLHYMKAYRSYVKKDTYLPNTQWLGDHLVTLPLYPDLTKKEVEYIIKNVRENSQILYP